MKIAELKGNFQDNKFSDNEKLLRTTDVYTACTISFQ